MHAIGVRQAACGFLSCACDACEFWRVRQQIPSEHRNKIARFLEAQGLKAEALDIATDNDYKFELAVQLGKLDQAYKIVLEGEVAAGRPRREMPATDAQNRGLEPRLRTEA